MSAKGGASQGPEGLSGSESALRWRDLEREAARQLAEAGVPDADYDARALLLEALRTDGAHYLMMRDEAAEEDAARLFRNLAARRKAREPLQQILGEAPFFGRSFLVSRDVLVPRFDTETLVEAVLPHLRTGMRILDLCTGSGCILLSLLLEGPAGLWGCGGDISRKALDAAEANGARFAEELAEKGSSAVFAEGDLYGAAAARDLCGAAAARKEDTSRGGDPCDKIRFDVVVSNPPYIRRDVIPCLMPEVRDFEPHMALDGGEDGLTFYRRIAAGASEFLAEGGLVALEIGYDQAEEVSHILRGRGFADVQVFRDAGGSARAVCGRLDQV